LVQLKRLSENNARRAALTRRYQDGLQNLAPLALPFQRAPVGSTYHFFPVVLADPERRPEFMRALAKQQIQTSIHYPPIHRFSSYRKLWPADYAHRLPQTEDATSRLVTLPLFSTMSDFQVERVISSTRAFFLNNLDRS
jgi:dTDP-4-amino-4,6-dideoxygalactose transaminase